MKPLASAHTHFVGSVDRLMNILMDGKIEMMLEAKASAKPAMMRLIYVHFASTSPTELSRERIIGWTTFVRICGVCVYN